MAHVPLTIEADFTRLIDEEDKLATELADKISAPQPVAVPVPITPGSTTDLIASLPADAARALQRSQRLTADLSAKTQANTALGAEQAEVASSAIVAGIAAQQLITLTQDQAALQAQRDTQAVDRAAGGHDARVRRATDQFENEQELETLAAKRAEIHDEEHSGIFIIDAIINDFRSLSTDIDIQEVHRDQATSIAADKAATASVQRASQTNILVAETVTEGSIVANQKVIAATGAAQLYEVQLAQNQSNAVSLKTQLSASNAEMQLIMDGYSLLNSAENRKVQREGHQLQIAANERASALSVITLSRQAVELELARLRLKLEGGVVDTKISAQIRALEQQETNLLQSGIDLNISEATESARIEAVGVALERSKVDLAAGELALEQEQDPTRKLAIEAQNQGLINRVEREEFEFQELKDTQAVRVARGQGQLDAQGQAATLADLSIQAAQGTLSAVLARAKEEQRVLTSSENTRLLNAQNIQGFQAFIGGKKAVETMDEIEQQLANNNPAYILMRQLGSAKGAKGEFVLAAPDQYALANERLAVFEGLYEVPNTIKGVRILREVRNRVQKLHEKSAANVPTDQIGRDIQFNKLTGEYLEEINAEYVFGDGTNPIEPLTIPQYIDLSDPKSGFVNQPLTKILNDKGQEDTNMNQIVSHGIVAMQGKALSLDQLVSGLVSLGSTIAVNNSTAQNGLAVIGAPYQERVNMRVLRPKGFAVSLIDTLLSSVTEQASFGASIIGPAAATSLVLTAGTISIASGVGSDFMIVNFASPVDVRQYIISILSSTTLGGDTTPGSLTGEED